MARASSTLDLSEFFNSDDSDGLRLAEFLQQRRGVGVHEQNYLFMNCEPQRLSLNIQLEKIATPKNQNLNANNSKADNSNKEILNAKIPLNKQDDNELTVAENIVNTNNELPVTQNGNNKEENNEANECNRREAVSPVQSDDMKGSSVPKDSPLRLVSPRISSIRKNCVSPSDRLRRYSMIRLSKICSGRRTLLQEFESTVSDSNFRPPVCSTPFSGTPIKKLTPQKSSCCPEIENVAPNSPKSSTNTNDLCCPHTDTLIRSLQKKDDELKDYLNNVLDETLKKMQNQGPSFKNKDTVCEKDSPISVQPTKSPLKRTYTVEKGSTPGQVILTPEKNSRLETPDTANNMRSRAISYPGKTLKSSEKISQFVTSNMSVNKTISQAKSPISNFSKRLGTMQRKEPLGSKDSNHELPNTPTPNNISIIFPTQESMHIEIPGTQKITTENTESRVVIIPVTQNFNGTCIDKKDIKNSETIHNKSLHQSNNRINELNEDNIKITDIITDDEEETPNSVISEHSIENSKTPLNLAPIAYNTRRQRRRKLKMNTSNVLSGEIENQHQPQAHSNSSLMTQNRITKKSLVPLNKAPGIPLNGEQFAEELRKLSNYEILDLRKRNSLGGVFAKSVRKSTRAIESAVKKQQQELDDQIEMELLRRNFQSEPQKNSSHTNAENITEKSQTVNEAYPLAPEKFRDPLNLENIRDSSLVDEKSTDRISFKRRRTSNQGISKIVDRGKMADLLKNYLEVSKLITLKKRRSNYNNQTRRSLYSQELSESPEKNSSEENLFVENKRSSTRNTRNKGSLPCIPSPPNSNSKDITIPKVVSPPPPIIPLSVSQTREDASQQESEPLLPPPPEFDSDSGISSNTCKNNIPNNTTKQTMKETDLTKDDDIFKKPMLPPQKRRGCKPKTAKSVSNKTLQTTISDVQVSDKSADESVGTLRRSKRGQVPSQNPFPLIQMLINKNLEKKLLEQKQKDRKKNLSKSKQQSDESIQSKSILQPKKKRKTKPILPTIPEDDPLVVPSYQNVKTDKKKTTKKNKTKAKEKQKQSNISSNETLERSHLTLTNPPPIEHINNVFDQLRNSSCLLNSPSKSHNHRTIKNLSEQQISPKTKPFRIRVARSKLSSQTQSSKPKEAATADETLSVHRRGLRSPSTCSTHSQGTSITTNNDTTSNHELILWLKNISESNSMADRSETIFKEMRISAATNLSFTELQGVEYAFYDTQDKASLGYLRFKPFQKKPKKRAKLFHLHFITLVGKFRITANDEETIMNVGDMVAIEKFVYYFIENLTDDIGILMVIKK